MGQENGVPGLFRAVEEELQIRLSIRHERELEGPRRRNTRGPGDRTSSVTSIDAIITATDAKV